MAQLTSGFPAYFPDGAAGLAFVPDHALATTMFAEVARTGRAAGGGTHLTIFEGELSLRGTEPVFQVLRTLSATAKGRAGAFEPAGG